MSVDRITDMFPGTQPGDTAAQIGTFAQRLGDIADEMGKAKDEDTARWTALNEERKAVAQSLADLKASHEKAVIDAETKAAMEEAVAAKASLATLRTLSKAGIIGSNVNPFAAGLSGYQKGAFIKAVMDANGRDYEAQAAGKAALASIGSSFQTPEEAGSKATLGTTDATGGWVIPNAIVDSLAKPARYSGAVRNLVSARRGLSGVYQVDIPFRAAAPNRAVVAPWGDTKENVNLTYNGYTATLYTLARVHDISKQFARKSAGAAEQDVMEELGHAFALGEAYYILQGSGSSEPYGLQTAITNAPATYTSSFTASTTTQAGSIIFAITTAAGVLAGRNRTPEAAVVNPAQLWTLASQGTDNAGFFLDVTTDPQNPTLRVFGVPVYGDSQIAGADDLIVGEWSALKVYYGDSYRVDSSDVAGTRWDANLIGFRGEMEMGLDARPAVYTGAFQFIADILG